MVEVEYRDGNYALELDDTYKAVDSDSGSAGAPDNVKLMKRLVYLSLGRSEFGQKLDFGQPTKMPDCIDAKAVAEFCENKFQPIEVVRYRLLSRAD